MLQSHIPLEPVVEPVLAALGSHLKAAYLYGSYAQGFYQPGESDINLLVVTDETADIHAVRQAVQKVWTAEVAAAFQHPPALVTQNKLARHLRLNPALASHLVHEGEHLTGEKLVHAPDTLAPADMLAQDINRAMLLSSVVADHLLEKEIAVERWQQLRQLARRLSRQPQPKDAAAVTLFSLVQRQLQKRFVMLAEQLPGTVLPDEPAPALLPDLQAIYEVTEEVLLVLPDLTDRRLALTDWHEVGDLLAGDYNGIRLTTPAQFYLALKYADPLGIRLMRYSLAWGRDGLGDVPVDAAAICRQAARYTSHILTTVMPQMYLAADDEKVGKVIHDIQNKLLNVQLQHELLHRLLGWERILPPTPLPDRQTPASERIDANLAHLDWWTNYYSEKL